MKKLKLRSETVRMLTDSTLGHVVGGSNTGWGTGCANTATCANTEYCPTFQADCDLTRTCPREIE